MATKKPRAIGTTLLSTVGNKTVPVTLALQPGLRARLLPLDADLPTVVKLFNEFAGEVQNVLAMIQTSPLLGASYVTDVPFTAATDKEVVHGILEGTVRALIPASTSVGAKFLEVSQSTGKMTLRADVTCVADVFFFRKPTR